MRFAFVSTLTGGSWAGSEELWGGAAMRLLRDSHDIAACVKHWPRLAPRVLEMRDHGADVFTWRKEHDHWFYKVLHALDRREPPEFRKLRAFRPDLVVISQGSHTDGLPWMKFCKEAGLPYVAIVQCNAEIWWLGDAAAARLASGYLGARRVFCVSHHNRELLEFQIGHPLPNAEVVWNPFKPAPAKPHPWPDGGVTRIACVARINPNDKGHDLLMRVMVQPKWRERPLEINLYGPLEPYGDIMKRMAARLGATNVHFHGEVEDVNAIWATNHILILPSRFEGMPIALVETMFNARAGIVTDVGGNKELIVDGESGFIIPAPTPELVDAALERAWARRGDWEAMGRAALARAQQVFPADPAAEFSKRLLGCAKD